MKLIATLKSASLTVALLGATFSAAAEGASSEPTPDWTFPGTAAVTSDYIFRGLTQAETKPAVQAGIEADHASGFYLGTWGSSISWLRGAGSDGLEADYYAGFRNKFGGGDWAYDVGVYGYYYPGTYAPGFTSANTDELYASLGYKFLSLKYSYSLTNWFGLETPTADSKGSGYLDLSANYEFVPSWTLNAHVGHQAVAGFSDLSYTDYKLGVTKAFTGNWSAALAYTGTDIDETKPTQGFYQLYKANGSEYNQGRSTVALTVTKTF